MNIPDVISRFKDYHARNPTWGSLHVVLEDRNVRDAHIHYCITYAREIGDVEGEALGKILLGFTKTQRRRLGAIT